LSQKPNPKTPAIREMLMRMAQTKQIKAELECQWRHITDQAKMMGLVRVYLTREERLLIGERRKMRREEVP
jgi:hypothetical protein